MNRWLRALAGTLVMLCGGLIYAWTVLSVPIAAEFPQWSKTSLSLTFTLVMIFFCLGSLLAGILIKKISAATFVKAAGILLAVGLFLSSRISSLTGLYISFGVICGFAVGLVYSPVLSTVGRWFPDKSGLVSGMMLMGFGLSSLIVGKVFQACTPETLGAWRGSFVVIGLIAGAIIFACSFLINPPAEEAAVKPKTADKNNADSAVDVPTGKMLKKPVFWVYYLNAVILGAAGLMLVSQASGAAREAVSGISPATVATVSGLISVANGLSRLIFGGVYDRRGCSFTMTCVDVLFVLSAVLLLLALKSGALVIFILGALLGGLAYGGAVTLNPAFMTSHFGMKYYALNFSIVNTNMLFGSFGSTIAGMIYDSMGSYSGVYFAIMGVAAASFVCMLAIRAFDAKSAKRG